MATVTPSQVLSDVISRHISPGSASHKGQNGRLLVIGGSDLFHAAILWSASAASRIVDHVHFCSTVENNKVFVNLKSKFVDGIVIQRENLLNYVDEDDCILIGPGMIRREVSEAVKNNQKMNFHEILDPYNSEADFTYSLLRYLLRTYPQKKFTIDAGALQMLEPEWLLQLETMPILTPHAWEFKRVFDIDISEMSDEEKIHTVQEQAAKYKSTILLKNITDYISDGTHSAHLTGGNAGLAKGGSGDILSGISAAFYTMNEPFDSCVLASDIVKTTAEMLYEERGLLFNSTDIVFNFSKAAKNIILGKSS